VRISQRNVQGENCDRHGIPPVADQQVNKNSMEDRMRNASLVINGKTLVQITAALGMTLAGVAAAEEPRMLSGIYAYTGGATCLTSVNGFTANLVPVDAKTYSGSYNTAGTATFNADGSGTISGRVVYTNFPPALALPGFTYSPNTGSLDFSFSTTGSANPDGSFTVTPVPGTYVGRFLSGTRLGQTLTVNQPPARVVPSRDGSTLVESQSEPTQETISFSNNTAFPRICNRWRVYTRVGGDSERD
jgi:hypothetical protein